LEAPRPGGARRYTEAIAPGWARARGGGWLRGKEVTAIDILYLLDRLEEVLNAGSRLPFSSRTMIDEQECLDILDQIRVALPEEIKQARRVIADRDTIVAEAEGRAQQIVREAEERAAEKVEEHALVRQAQLRAEQVEADAEQRSEEIRQEADEYAFDILSRLDEELEQLLLSVRKGVRALRPLDEPRAARRSGGLG
jgi:hypothetical protein